MQLLNNANYDFLRWKWHAIALSAIVILAGLGLIATKGMPLGIDFSGGTLIVVQFEQPVTEEQVRNAVDSLPGEEVVQQYGDAAERRIMIRLPQVEGAVEGNSLEQARRRSSRRCRKRASRIPLSSIANWSAPSSAATCSGAASTPRWPRCSRSRCTSGSASDSRLRSVPSSRRCTTCSSRWPSWSFFGYDLSLNVVAAILTITGYSVNDTIVIFDRVRENLRSRRREPLDKVVNESVNQTLSRTIITAGTTFLSVLSIFLFGGEALRGFSFTMLVGIVSGTYSTVFIASAIAIILSAGKARSAAATATSGDVVQGGKKQKRARAS